MEEGGKKEAHVDRKNTRESDRMRGKEGSEVRGRE